jgi:uncharacterized protein (TIGR02996 family)
VSREALLAAIYDAPGDLAARAVYADWLLDRGDPRGELITLQLREVVTKEQEARARELVDAHAEQWIGRLTEITTWIEFEGGFLARCGLSRIPKWAIGRREWATVKHIGISDDWSRDIGPLVTHETMKSLESLRVPSRAFVALLASSYTARMPVRRMTLDGNVTASQWTTLEQAPLFAQLRELDIRGGVENATQIPASRYERVSMTLHGWVVTWKRGADERLSSLVVEPGVVRWGQKLEPKHLLSYFKALPADVVSAIDLGAIAAQVAVRDAKRALEIQVRIVGDL